MNITPDKLKQLAPTSKAEVREAVSGPLNLYLPDYQIFTKVRIAAFLAQAAHETAHFQTLEEYGGPKYWARYNNRADLGNREGTDDGVTYHGRGIFQLTGRANYERYGERLGLDLVNEPELAASGDVSVQVACLYWSDRHLNQLADREDTKGITRAINGGYNGLDNRLDYYQRAKLIDWI